MLFVGTFECVAESKGVEVPESCWSRSAGQVLRAGDRASPLEFLQEPLAGDLPASVKAPLRPWHLKRRR